MDDRPFRTRRRPPGRREPVTRSTYSADDILHAVRRWAALYGEPPDLTDWDPTRALDLGMEWKVERFRSAPWPTVHMVRGHFAGLREAIERAGFRDRGPRKRQKPPLAEPAAVLEAIVEWTRRYGDVPAMADWDPVRARRLGQDWRIARYNQGDWPSTRTVINRFGSFRAAVEAAGCLPRPRAAVPEERRRTRAENQRRAAELGAEGRVPGLDDLAQTLKALAGARSAEDPVLIRMALIDVASSALAWADAGTAH